MSNDDTGIISKEGFLQTKLFGQPKWHRRYCIIDWNKAILFVASKHDRQYGDYIKLLPKILIIDAEIPSDLTIEINDENQSHFLLPESRKEHDSWLIALKRTAYSRFGGGIFGQSLEDTYRYAADKTSLIPRIVQQCCEHLLQYGTTFVGLFRVPGKQTLIRELRDQYDRCQPVELNSSHSPATVSSLLKSYLQSLPEPIIPMKYFDDFLEIGSRFKYNQTSDLDNLKHLIEAKLSNISYAMLAYLCDFLRKLTAYAAETKMDTENFAIAFGSNLIRASEELDIQMIKGHSYNLIPLIKAMIENSEYLFSSHLNGLSEEEHLDSCDKNNESIRKSSGFSSFSSLLSSNEHPTLARTLSISLPSIPYAKNSLIDSAIYSFDGRSDKLNSQYHSQSLLDKPTSHISFQSKTPQSSTTYIQGESAINDENSSEKRLCNSERIDDGEVINRETLMKEPKRRAGIFSSRGHVSLPPSKSSKKTLVDKFGKSIFNFKTTMSRAFIPHGTSTENVLHANTIAVPSRRSVDLPASNNYLKVLHDEICVLKGVIDKRMRLLPI